MSVAPVGLRDGVTMTLQMAPVTKTVLMEAAESAGVAELGVAHHLALAVVAALVAARVIECAMVETDVKIPTTTAQMADATPALSVEDDAAAMADTLMMSVVVDARTTVADAVMSVVEAVTNVAAVTHVAARMVVHASVRRLSQLMMSATGEPFSFSSWLHAFAPSSLESSSSKALVQLWTRRL